MAHMMVPVWGPLVSLLVLLWAAAAPAPALGQPGNNLSSVSDLVGLYGLRASLGLRAREWPRKTDPCTHWIGVGCRRGRVVSLHLSGLRRTRRGRLNPRFAVDGLKNLTLLESFNSSGFVLPGPIPDWFGSDFGFGLAPTFQILDLSFCSVSGELPPSIAGVRGLKTLALSNNNISGSIPPQLGGLAGLAKLDLAGNSLSGELPEKLSGLQNLQTLNLSSNQLSGELPAAVFRSLSGLRSLAVAGNNFSGSLPDSLWSLRELRVLNASVNGLTGALPELVPLNARGNDTRLDLSGNLYYGRVPVGFRVLFDGLGTVDISGNYFDGEPPVANAGKNVSFGLNCFLDASNQRSVDECQRFYASRGLPYDGPVAPPAPQPQPSPPRKKRHKNLKYILAGAIGGGLLLVILVVAVAFCFVWARRQKTGQRESATTVVPPTESGAAAAAAAAAASGSTQPSAMSVNLARVGDSFAYEQLVNATSGFGDGSLIRHGHSGDLYHGVLEDGKYVVVKRIDTRVTKKDAYLVELDLFLKGLHERLVPFLGHCLDKEDEKFLVYRFVPNGDLSSALHRKSGEEEEGMQSLDWIKRLKIATGVAEALCYLHHECAPPMVHRDVQASSILLDDKFEVRLGSLSEVCAQEEGHQNVITKLLRFSSTSEQGASGAPSATCAYDVYCFGKVLLELVTGKLGISGSNYAEMNELLERILPYINIYEKELVSKIIDPSLIIDEDHLEEVWAMAIVAKSCLNPKPSKRPPMKYILKALENPLKVVREDNSSSSARLRATSSRGSWNAAFFGSWRHSSSDIGPLRDENMLKRSETIKSGSGSNGEHSFSHRRQSKEIFPEPSGSPDDD